MKKILSFIAGIALFGTVLVSCQKADEVIRNESNELADIYATLEGMGSERLFNPRYSAQKDTIYFDIPYFYPEDSDNEVSLSKIIVRSTVPADAVVTPVLGQVMDVSKPFNLSITSGAGVSKKYMVVSRKVGNTSVYKAWIRFQADGSDQEIEAVINGSDVIFYALPGTDLSKVVLNLQINKHSTTSITSGTEINLSQDVPLTITGVDGGKKVYQLKAVEPLKLNYGVGINRKLWTKTGAELGFTKDNETGIAVSGDHLILVVRSNPSKYRVFNRHTGEYLQDMTVPFAGLAMEMVADEQGNLLGANYVGLGGRFFVYKWKNALDPNPVKLIEWTNNTPRAANSPAWGMGVGRSINVYGSVDGSAVITTTGTATNAFQKWTITNGQLVSNTPETVIYKGVGTGNLGVWSEAQPISAAADGNYFMAYAAGVKLVNGVTHEDMSALALGWPVVYTRPVAYAQFNNANFLAVVKFVNSYSLNQVQMSLFDVTQTHRFSMSPSDEAYGSFNVFNSALLSGTTNPGTADVCIGFSADKERMQVYTLLTNGGIMAHEFTKYTP